MAKILVLTDEGRVVASFHDSGGQYDAPTPSGLPHDIAEAMDAARQEDLKIAEDKADKYKAPPVTDEQKKIFDALTSGKYSNFALMSGIFQGHPVAYACVVNQAENGDLEMSPIAMIIDLPFKLSFENNMEDPNGRRMENDKENA